MAVLVTVIGSGVYIAGVLAGTSLFPAPSNPPNSLAHPRPPIQDAWRPLPPRQQLLPPPVTPPPNPSSSPTARSPSAPRLPHAPRTSRASSTMVPSNSAGVRNQLERPFAEPTRHTAADVPGDASMVWGVWRKSAAYAGGAEMVDGWHRGVDEWRHGMEWKQGWPSLDTFNRDRPWNINLSMCFTWCGWGVILLLNSSRIR